MNNAAENDKLFILNDQRKIQYIEYEGNLSSEVGINGVTKITAYGEPGEYCYKPWFAVYVGDQIARRVNASYVIDVLYDV